MKLVSISQVHATYIRESVLRSAAQVVLASVFMGLLAQIKVTLPFTPIPLSLQSFAVMLIGVFLGPKKGVLAVISYLVQGALGAPVWAGGSFGVLTLIGPSGGYLLGFMLQVYLIGKASRTLQSPWVLLTVLLASETLNLCIGSLWLSHFIPAHSSMALGFYPFLPGGVLKAFGVLFLAFKAQIFSRKMS